MSPRLNLAPPPRFEGRFTTDLDARRSYSTASGPFSRRPLAVAVPSTVEDVQALVRWASDEDLFLVPRGAGTGMPGGNVGEGIAVDLAASLDGVGAVDGMRSRIHVGAGAVAGEVARRAREHGLFIPSLPSSADRCTIGGMVANNAAGARTFKYGATRDWVEALDLVLADGRRVRLSADTASPDPFPELHRRLRPRWSALAEEWPGVRKNSSGYALDRFLPSGDPIQLMVGSEGTLGFVTGVTLRLARLPDDRALALLGLGEPDALVDGIRAAGEAGASACEFFGRRFIEMAELEDDPRVGRLARDSYALLLVEVDGTSDHVEDGIARLEGFARSVGSGVQVAHTEDERDRLWEIRHAASPLVARAAERGLISMQFIEDSVVPPVKLPDYLRGLDRILLEAETDAVVFGHAGDGNVHVNPLVDVDHSDWRDRVRWILDETVELVAGLGGTLAGEHGDGRVRAPFIESIWSDVAVRSFRDVKRVLDPGGILNPGVILPEPDQDPLEGVGAAHRTA